MAPKAAAMKKTGSFDSSKLNPNDHVFVSPPWALREGEPYAVARVIELLPPLAPHSSSSSSSGSVISKAKKNINPQRVRLAYFLRPRDISNRYFSDFRLVITTMHSDIVPLTYIRGLCQVKHKEEIEDMEAYKREKNSFYWSQLYDRYLHRYFDAVPTDKIQNAPANITQHLVAHFEFVVCEVGMGPELCDAQRGCAKCFKWAASPESVICARCKHAFHLGCLEPPLLQKPRVGYSWSCAPCSRAHDEEVESYMETGISKKVVGTSNGTEKEKEALVAKDKGKGKEVVRRTAGSPRRTTQGWPFRYYGMHTDSTSVLDPHDSLYPRASTRLGNKFQAIVPDWDEERGEQVAAAEVSSRVYFPKKPRVSAPKSRKNLDKNAPLQRGEDEAAKIIFSPLWNLPDAALDPFVANLKKFPTYAVAGVDLINRGLSLLDDGTDPVAALVVARKFKQKELGHAVWTVEEKAQLVQGAKQHGNDLEEIADEIKTKKIKDVVKLYYISLGHAMQEDVPQQMEEKAAAASKLERKGSSKKQAATDSDEEGSVCGEPVSSAAKRARTCAVCLTKTSLAWYRCPPSIGQESKGPEAHVMCDDCSLRWRNYGVQYPPTADELKMTKPLIRKPEKVEPAATPVTKEVTKARSITPPVPLPPPPPKKVVIPAKPCVLCKRLEPKTSLAQCTNCTLSVHTSCFGIGEEITIKDWMCDLCAAAKKHEEWCSKRSCILCPCATVANLEVSLTALECLKPTEQHHYIHLLCGVWHPEIKFGVPAEFRIAEGVSLIPEKRRAQECFICKAVDFGACVKCEDCPRHFHVACAWSAGYKFAFEIKPLKKKSSGIIVKFKEEEGAMSACIWCSEHRFSATERVTYDLGSKDTESKLTALQTYVRSYKGAYIMSAHAADDFAILRQARHLDTVIAPVLVPVKIVVPPPPAPAKIRPVAALPIAALPIAAPPVAAPPVAAPPVAGPSHVKPASNPAPKPPSNPAPKPPRKLIVKAPKPPPTFESVLPPLPPLPPLPSLPTVKHVRASVTSKKIAQSKRPSPPIASSSTASCGSPLAIPWDTLPPLPDLPTTTETDKPTATDARVFEAASPEAGPPAKRAKIGLHVTLPPLPQLAWVEPAALSPGSSSASPRPQLTPLALDHSNSPLLSASTSSSAREAHQPSPSSSTTSSTTQTEAKRRHSKPKPVVEGPPPVCANCGTSSSPLFRRDAEGRNICNACGLYFRAHGKHRPSGLASRGGPGEWRIAKRRAQEEGIPIAPTIPLPLKKPRAKPRPSRTVRRLAAAAKAAALLAEQNARQDAVDNAEQTPPPPPSPVVLAPPAQPTFIPRPPHSTFVPRTGVYPAIPSRLSQLPLIPQLAGPSASSSTPLPSILIDPSLASTTRSSTPITPVLHQPKPNPTPATAPNPYHLPIPPPYLDKSAVPPFFSSGGSQFLLDPALFE